MRCAARIWPNLTQVALILALFSGCSRTLLPLDPEGNGWNPRSRDDERPVVLAGTGARTVPSTTGAAGVAGLMPSGSIDPVEPICGNGRLDLPLEACDNIDLNGATCMSLGFNGGGTLLCNPTTCHFDAIRCRIVASQPTTPTQPDLTGADAGVGNAAQ